MAPRTLARRLSAALGAATVGVAATLALATPASAHKITISAEHVCETATGEWIITWKLQNDYNTDATVQSVESDQPGAIDGIEQGTVVPKRSNRVDGVRTGVQRVPGSVTSVSLKVKAVWLSDDFTREAKGTEKLKGGPCNPTPTPTPTPPPPSEPPPTPGTPSLGVKADCDEVTLTVANPKGNKPTDVTVTYGAETKSATVASGGTETFTFPLGEENTAKATFADLDLTLEGKFTKPSNCTAPPGLPVTGSNVGGIVAGAVGAVVAGAALFVFFRRRRVTFTA